MTCMSARPPEFMEPLWVPRRDHPADGESATLIGEVALPSPGPGHDPDLRLEGWSLRLWPQARLGDATLEARPLGSQRAEELLDGLRRQGVTVLGPLRQRRP